MTFYFDGSSENGNFVSAASIGLYYSALLSGRSGIQSYMIALSERLLPERNNFYVITHKGRQGAF